RDPLWIGFNLLFFSIFIYLADRKAAQALEENSFSLKHTLLIGLAQSIALMPGASRSGMTIMAALFLGYTRGAAARLSFLLGTPIILAAVLLEACKISPERLNAASAAGLAASFTTGLAVIGLLMAWLKKRTLTPFIIYRVILGAAILWLFRGS
ncbi:MAG: undecaprenyl-diphosphate phosphatase, partial [Elusimicrobiota bacterium]